MINEKIMITISILGLFFICFGLGVIVCQLIDNLINGLYFLGLGFASFIVFLILRIFNGGEIL